MECFLKGLGIFFLIVNHVFKHLGNKYNASFFFFKHDQVSSPPDGKILGFKIKTILSSYFSRFQWAFGLQRALGTIPLNVLTFRSIDLPVSEG